MKRSFSFILGLAVVFTGSVASCIKTPVENVAVAQQSNIENELPRFLGNSKNHSIVITVSSAGHADRESWFGISMNSSKKMRFTSQSDSFEIRSDGSAKINGKIGRWKKVSVRKDSAYIYLVETDTNLIMFRLYDR